MTKAHNYCKNKTAQSGSSFYYSFLFLPKEKRKAMYAIYAFCREVDDIVDNHITPSVAKAKLKWWVNEINRIYNGNPIHPIGHAIKDLLPHFTFKKEHFLEMLDGMFMDLQHEGFETFSDLKKYCYNVASTAGLLSIEIFKYKNQKTIEYATNLGIAFQLVNIIRDVGEDAKNSRVYLPKADLEKFNLTYKDILENVKLNKNFNLDPDKKNNFIKLMKYEADRAKEYYKKALNILPIEDRPNQKCALIMARIYFELLEKIIKCNFNVLGKKIKLNPLKKIMCAINSNNYENKLKKELLKQET